MFKLLTSIQKNLSIAIPLTMILGLLVSFIGDMSPLKSTIMPITFLMVYPMMVSLPFKKLFTREGGAVQWGALAINFVVSPLVALGIGQLFFADAPYLKMALLLLGVIPTSGMTIAWTGMAGGNRLAAIKMTLIGLLVGALLAPIYSSFLLGAEISLPIVKIALQITSVVVVPLTLGIITKSMILKRFTEEQFVKEIKPKVSLLSTLGVILMVFVAMALKGKGIVRNPEILLAVIPAILLFYIVLFAISFFWGNFFYSQNNAIALVYGTAMRNLSVVLAIVMSLFGEEGGSMALLLSLAYVIQIQSAVLFLKFGVPRFSQMVRKNGLQPEQ